jgi:hypothetical protein
MTTSEHSTASLFAEESISSPVDSRVRTFPLRGRGKALKASEVDSGSTCSGLFEKPDHLGSLLRTRLVSALKELTGCSVAWKKRATPAGRSWWVLTTVGDATNESEFGSLPTPTTMDTIERKGMRPSRAATNRKSGYLSEVMLPTPKATDGDRGGRGDTLQAVKGHSNSHFKAPKLIPTPGKSDVTGGSADPDNRREQGHMVSLSDEMRGVLTKLATPCASAAQGSHGGGQGRSLRTDLHNLRHGKVATPTARDWKSGKASDATMERNSRPLSEQIGGSLEPRFVEQVMGYQIGWTELPPSEIQSCRKLRTRSSGVSRKETKI